MIIYCATAYWDDMSEEGVTPITCTGPTEEWAIANLQATMPKFPFAMVEERRQNTCLVVTECIVEGHSIVNDETGEKYHSEPVYDIPEGTSVTYKPEDVN